MRGTSNRNARGNTVDRLARRKWLVKTFAADVTPWTGATYDPDTDAELGYCRCFRCGKLLNVETVTADRIVPGCKGGTYRRNNIRPACMGCNRAIGARVRS
jgi:hypothetical protein